MKASTNWKYVGVGLLTTIFGVTLLGAAWAWMVSASYRRARWVQILEDPSLLASVSVWKWAAIVIVGLLLASGPVLVIWGFVGRRLSKTQ